MDSINPPPLRVLARPPASARPPPRPVPPASPEPQPPPPPPPAKTTTNPLPQKQSQPRPAGGVTVVGFVSRNSDHSSQLINRVIDSNVFGSGNLDRVLFVESEEVKDWFSRRRISYYHDEERGMLFLQFREIRLVHGSGSDESELEDLQGLLFMFSVCHEIIYIMEGSRVDTHIFSKLRVLQGAKHALVPYFKSKSSYTPPSRGHSPNPLPRGRTGRNASSVSLMSGSGSHSLFYPGCCTPVLLFVFVDDFPEGFNGSSNGEESTKGSGSVVVLARPPVKSEGGVRKKMQSSIEAQIRFLIKKCRVLLGSEGGSRGGGVPLFSLDASRAVVLLDRCTVQGVESLDFATKLVDEVLNGKATSDSLLLESNVQSGNKDDVFLIKEFLLKQSDILRGRGGFVAGGNGVGMAAVAAAAAAASAASGKTFSAPELPSFDAWLSNSRQLLHGLLNAKTGLAEQTRQRNEDLSVSLLEKATGLNSKFSTSWCERALPTAKDIYLHDLPPCYPTSVHETRLANALRGFYSMVRGPAVQTFAKRLEDECTKVWESGRQQCDVVSLTGKPCIHQRHEGAADSHCSGYFFLHACACGRSRQLRPDPFSFEFANASNYVPDCDKGLPLVQLPVRSSAWTLIRVGGARYYEPSKGLIQSGFPVAHKFLSRWIILLEKPTNHVFDLNSVADRKKVDDTPEIQTRNSNPTKQLDNGRSDERKISFGTGLPNLTMRKPFSEVVAGSGSGSGSGSSTRDSGFPPLQHRSIRPNRFRDSTTEQVQTTVSDKSIKQNRSRDSTTEQVQKSEDVSSSSLKISSSVASPDCDPLLRIGSNVVPMNINSRVAMKSNPVVKHAVVYFGFEHECPYGHRFFLNEDHLNELGSAYSMQKESDLSNGETSNRNLTVPSSLGRKGGRGKSMNVATGNRMRNAEKSKEIRAQSADRIHHLSGAGRAIDASVDPNRVKDLGTNLQSLSMDDNGSSSSMLNRNIPLFMNCPYCRLGKGKKDPKVNFAGTISQLQRIFLVTPPFPVVLAVSPVIQFEASCLPPSVVDREQKLQFTIGSQVVLPPESFLTLRLPFIYGVQLEDGRQHPLGAFKHQPEMTAWIVKGTTLHIVSKQNNVPQESQT
ncbi:Nonsense-mediated mRNA decay factor SMG8 [Linum grandiflorum]